MPRWTFVRHGESTANAEGTLAGHRDVPLTPVGRQQALALGTSLADVPFARVLVSDLQRARMTLQLALPQAPPTTVLEGLRERSVGEWEQLDRAALAAQGGFDLLLDWQGRPPGGESLSDLLKRVLTTLVTHDARDDTLVVAHGGLMRVVLGVLDQESSFASARVKYPNCAVQTRDVAFGTWARLLQEHDE